MTLAALRVRATVMSHFEVSWLGGDAATDDAVSDLLSEDCGRVAGPDGVNHWALAEGVRRSVVGTAGVAELREARQAVDAPSGDPQQWAIDQLLDAGTIPDLDDLAPEQAWALESVARWLGAAQGIPSYEAVRNRVRLREFLAPLRVVESDRFIGRDELLARLAGELNAGAPPLLVHGVGGVGKSAVVARHLRQSIEQHHALIGYLNFDHSALDPTRSPSLVQAMATQLALQLDGGASQDANKIARAARDRLLTAGRRLEVSSKRAQVRGDRVSDLLSQLASLMHGRPYVLVLDTLEEVQRRDRSAVRVLLSFLRELHGFHHAPQILLAGRAPMVELQQDRQFHLDGLEHDEAVRLLRALYDGDDIDLEQVVESVGTSPLCIRLVAGVLRHEPDGDGLRDLQVGRAGIEGALYRRLLGHISDPAVRRLAHPGLTLRRVTPDVIRHVLARPCRVPVPDDMRARELFEGLGRELMLVERGPDDAWLLLHRTDVRRMMLEPLASDNEEVVRSIHRAAVKYYSHQDGVVAATEAMYHRLMLAQQQRTLNRSWHDDLLPGLVGSLDELPPASKAYLASQAPDLGVSDEDLRAAELDSRRRLVARRVEGLVANGDRASIDEAGIWLEAHVDDDATIVELRVQVAELAGRLDEARDLSQAARRRAARRGATSEFVVFTLHAARIAERAADPDHARAILDQALALLDGVEPTEQFRLLDLRATVARLALARREGDQTDHALVSRAIELYDGLGARAVRRVPGLLRDLAAEVGTHSTSILQTTLRSVGLGSRLRTALSGEPMYHREALRGEPTFDRKFLHREPTYDLYDPAEPEPSEIGEIDDVADLEPLDLGELDDPADTEPFERGELGRAVSELVEDADDAAASALAEAVSDAFAMEADEAIDYEPEVEGPDASDAEGGWAGYEP